MKNNPKFLGNFRNRPQKHFFMIYGYIRVSTDKQSVENQRFEINNFCSSGNIRIDKWIEEKISGNMAVEKRKLGSLLKRLSREDVLICSEISRLGRNLMMIMSILNECMQKEIKVWTIKDNYRLGNDINSKVLAFAFGLSAEIERNLISQRTREALARKKNEGIKLGRPKGKTGKLKLTKKDAQIRHLLRNGTSISAIARKMKVSRTTATKYIKEMGVA